MTSLLAYAPTLIANAEMEQCKTLTKKPTLKRKKAFTHRTKTGCATCRRRKIKCDEKKPKCSNCINSKRQCPGYLSAGTFAAEKTEVIPIIPTAPRTLSLSQFDGSKDAWDLFHLLPALNRYRGSHAGVLVGPLFSVARGFLKHLPSRASQHAALDAAASCFAKGIRELLTNNYGHFNVLVHPTTELTTSYTTALGKMRHSLYDEHQSSMPETTIAVVLICCFETLRVGTQKTLQWHLTGLSKILEHRGVPKLNSSIDAQLLGDCLALVVMSSFFSNTPCFLAESNWSEVIQRQRAARPTERARLFVDVWHLNLLVYTLLADCSQFIIDANTTNKDLSGRRAGLLSRLDSLKETWSERCEKQINDVMNDDAEADLMSMFEKLSEAKDFSVGYIINYLNAYPGAFIIFDLLRVALGGHDALAAAENASKLATWLDAFARREPPHTYYSMDVITEGILRATIETQDEWRDFALEVEISRQKMQPQVIRAEIMERWLRLAGVTPRR